MEGERADDATTNEERSSFLTGRLTAELLRLGIGFTCFVAWVNLLFCFEGVLRDEVAYGGGVVHDPFFVAATLVAALLLIGSTRASRLSQRATPESGNRKVQLMVSATVGAASGALGVFLSATATGGSVGLQVFAGIAGAVAGWFIMSFTLRWGSVVSAFDLREVLVVLCAAFCIQWLLFVAVVFTGTAGRMLCAIVLPLCSGWCLRWFTDETGNVEAENRRASSDHLAKRSRVTNRIAGALFCFSFVIQFVWTSNVVFSTEPLDAGLFWAVFVAIFFGAASVMAAVLLLMNRWRSYRMELFYRVAFVFGIAASCALGLVNICLFASYVLVYVAYALIVSTMWMLSWSVVFMQREGVCRVFGRVFGFQYLALFCGFVAVKVLQSAVDTSFVGEALPLFCLFAAVVLALAYAMVLPERTLLLLSPRLFKLSHESLGERCRDISSQYNLTARESEIFSLLARGRDVGYIEKKLFISRNTVNTHRKNLYRKLGIHTQQELLSLIENELT